MIRRLLNRMAHPNGSEGNGEKEAAAAEKEVFDLGKRIRDSNGDFERRCLEVQKKLDAVSPQTAE